MQTGSPFVRHLRIIQRIDGLLPFYVHKRADSWDTLGTVATTHRENRVTDVEHTRQRSNE